MPTIEAPPTGATRFHIGLHVADLARSVRFYRTLFGLAPAKHFDDYAKFDVAIPPLVLALYPSPQQPGGALNHIGPETLKNAAAEVRDGKLFNLGLAFDRNGPQPGRGRFNPMVYPTDLFTPPNPAVPNVCFSDDVIHMPLQCATQWDALAHVHYDGQLYNGCSARDCLTSKGALKLGINHLAAPGILSRGVLLDRRLTQKTQS